MNALRESAVTLKNSKGMLFFIVLLGFLLACSNPAEGKPKISFQETEIDFGEVAEGTSATHNFVLQNIGTENLIIERVKTSCGCTAGRLQKTDIPPGESADLAITYESEKRPGEFEKEIYVYSNDPESPMVILTIFGYVKAKPAPKIGLLNRKIDLGEIPVNQNQSVTIEIANQGVAELIVTKIVSQQGDYELFNGEFKVSPGQTGRLRVNFLMDVPGAFRFIGVVHSNDPHLPTDYLQITGTGK